MAREETLEPYVSDLLRPPGVNEAFQEIAIRLASAVRPLDWRCACPRRASDLGGVLSPLSIGQGDRALLVRADGSS